MYQVVIVDDEVPQQETLRRILKEHFQDYRVVKICSSVEEGVEYLGKNKPDLVFLDVMMPPSNGFEMLQRLGDIAFEIIFTTSFDHFAIQAFKVAAVDYLLKPFGHEELGISIKKFEERFALKHPMYNISTLLQNINVQTSTEIKIALPVLTGFVFAKVNDIVRCESDNTYTTFYFTNSKPIVVARSLKECEDLLAIYDFCRVHNSHMVNLRHIDEYIKGDGGQVNMSDGAKVEVSRRKKDEFLAALKRI